MIKPKLLISKCFSQPVRYNGGIVNDEFISKLKQYIDFIDLCPELEIGLGVPRQRLIILDGQFSKRLIQPETGKDFTDKIDEFSRKTLSHLPDLDGFILKAKSPSCGVGSTKLYRNNAVIGKTYGLFAEAIKKAFPHLPLEDEGRLRDEGIRNHFLTRIFAYAEARNILVDNEAHTLVRFHTRYKYLLMTYSQKHLKELGKLVANSSIPIDEKFKIYRLKFYEAFQKKPTLKRHVNTLTHLMGHFSRKLNLKERQHLISLINQFGEGKISLKSIIELLKSISYRFDNDYILIQKYIEPYPEDLDV